MVARDLRAAGRAAAGDRARRRPRAAAAAAGAAGAARAPAGAAQRRPARPAGAPAFAARDAGVVLGRARARRSARCSRGCACSRAAPRWRRSTPSATRTGEPAELLLAAIMDTHLAAWSSRPARTRSRGSRCSTRCASSPPSRSRRAARRSCSSCRHAQLLPRLRRARGRAGGARGPARVARAASRSSAATCAWPSSGCCARARRGRAADRGRVRPHAAVGRARPRGPRLARTRR